MRTKYGLLQYRSCGKINTYLEDFGTCKDWKSIIGPTLMLDDKIWLPVSVPVYPEEEQECLFTKHHSKYRHFPKV